MLISVTRRKAASVFPCARSVLSCVNYRSHSSLSRFFKVSDAVKDAQATGKPVVALETTIYTHGYPYPENVALASHLESLVRTNGGVPAHIGVLNGVALVGMQAEELVELTSSAGDENTWKLSRRDLGFITGLGINGRKLNGGTTIASTMILAHLAGIKIFATGGLGGVHRGWERSLDISADLTELGRTSVAVISSGCKSFLDIRATLEYLETQGVGVGTFADGREPNAVDFPAFFSRDSGIKSPKVIMDEREAAAIVFAQAALRLQSGLLFANPVPVESGLLRDEIEAFVNSAVAEAEANGIDGSANTPYILKRIRELSGGKTVTANRALIEANVIRGTKVAVELAKLELEHNPTIERPNISALPRTHDHVITSGVPAERSNSPSTIAPQSTALLVAGSLAADTICDYNPIDPKQSVNMPAMYTSNPARISQSIGGVGHNVALAAHRAGVSVSLASAVADDLAGQTLLSSLRGAGLNSGAIQKLPATSETRTAQYVAFNDLNKDLVVAMADMDILSSPTMASQDLWTSLVSSHKPEWIVADANWSTDALKSIFGAGKTAGVPVAFEPVSIQKSQRLFRSPLKLIGPNDVVPANRISLATPNSLELKSMYNVARDEFLFDSEQWWDVVNNLNMSSAGSRDKLIAITNTELVDEGIPQQSIQLLPYIPNLVTKLGSKGCLLTMLLRAGDERLTDPDHAPYVLAKTAQVEDGEVGGVYLRLFPPAEVVTQDQIVSVNGVGDTLLGVLMAGLIKGQRLEEAIPTAQKAAVLTLKAKEAVSPQITPELLER